MAGEFAEVFSLYVHRAHTHALMPDSVHSVLTEATKPSLITAALQTLLRFLNWIPLGGRSARPRRD